MNGVNFTIRNLSLKLACFLFFLFLFVCSDALVIIKDFQQLNLFPLDGAVCGACVGLKINAVINFSAQYILVYFVYFVYFGNFCIFRLFLYIQSILNIFVYFVHSIQFQRVYVFLPMYVLDIDPIVNALSKERC